MNGPLARKLLLLITMAFALFQENVEAQIVQRHPGGGLTVRAPFVRVGVDPWGRTSVRAPFVAVDDPGTVRIGLQRRLARRQWRAERRAALAEQEAATFGQPETPAPTPAQAPPLPSAAEMASMDMVELIATLRDMSRLFQESLQDRFDDPGGWQRYLAIPEDALGTPGVEQVALRMDVLDEQLERYSKAAAGGKYAKIAAMPSFAATHAALELVMQRFAEAEPAQAEPAEESWQNDPGPVTQPRPVEALPVPPNPEPRRGERSILKRR